MAAAMARLTWVWSAPVNLASGDDELQAARAKMQVEAKREDFMCGASPVQPTYQRACGRNHADTYVRVARGSHPVVCAVEARVHRPASDGTTWSALRACSNQVRGERHSPGAGAGARFSGTIR